MSLCLCFAWTAQALIFDLYGHLPSVPRMTGFREGVWTVKLNPDWLNA